MASGITVTTNFQNYLNAITDLGKVYIRQEFTGGTDDALDSIDGANLETGVTAFVLKNDICYVYKYIDGATDPENPPYVVAPDTNPNGRWFLYSVSDADRLDGYHASKTPSANTIPVLNSAGQLQLPFSQNPILVNGQSYSKRTFYVDAVDGDDSNDGSEAFPFKTVGKAINATPIGGFGEIHIKNTVETTSNLTIINKYIRLVLNDGQLIFKSYIYDDTYNAVYGFSLYNSVVEFYTRNSTNFPFLVVDGSSYDSTKTQHSVMQSGVRITSAGGLVVFDVNNADVNATDQDLIYVSENGYGLISLGGAVATWSQRTFVCFAMRIEYGGYFRIGSDSHLLHIKGNALLGLLPFDGTHFQGIRDENGNSLQYSDVIMGIVKDANGVPRNVVSNIVF